MIVQGRKMKAIGEYIKHKPSLRDQILDRGELKRGRPGMRNQPSEGQTKDKGAWIRFDLEQSRPDNLEEIGRKILLWGQEHEVD